MSSQLQERKPFRDMSAHEVERGGMTGNAHETVELLEKGTGNPNVHSPSSSAAPPQPHKARWLNPEYLFYIAFLLWCYYQAFTIVMRLSDEAPSWRHRFLQAGWMFDRRVDVADGQYRFFRNELATLVGAAAGFLLLSHAVKYFTNNSLKARLRFYGLFSLGFLVFVNGSCVIFIAIIITLNYLCSSLGGISNGKYSRIASILTWVFNCGILLANERYHGYWWHYILLPILGPDSTVSAWLDTHRGLFPWQGLFNLVVLRMISFNFDRIWTGVGYPLLERDGKTVLTLESHMHVHKCKTCLEHASIGATCVWWREKQSHATDEYNPLTYFVYLFYVPLHFAGPTITFNSFLSHIKVPQQTYSTRGLLSYFFVKVVFIFLLLEWWLHYLYVFSFTNSDVFLTFTPYEMALTSYFTLVAIWLKFTAIWRFFRCWALFDGVEPPENMNRCVSNNYSIQSFWRAWHRSFNRWLVRYIYVPLGGGGKTPVVATSTSSAGASGSSGSAAASSSNNATTGGSDKDASAKSSASFCSKFLHVLRQSFNIFITFSFVAFWHDRTMQLLTWGWLVALLFIPELSAQAFFHMASMRWIKKKWYFRHIQAAGAALSIFMMMIANLIGYSVGINGTSSIVSTMVNQGGLSMFVVIFFTFFAAANLMFEFRATGITVDN